MSYSVPNGGLFSCPAETCPTSRWYSLGCTTVRRFPSRLDESDPALVRRPLAEPPSWANPPGMRSPADAASRPPTPYRSYPHALGARATSARTVGRGQVLRRVPSPRSCGPGCSAAHAVRDTARRRGDRPRNFRGAPSSAEVVALHLAREPDVNVAARTRAHRDRAIGPNECELSARRVGRVSIPRS
jgi:hypothetical protein